VCVFDELKFKFKLLII